MRNFPHEFQLDTKDCGPACIKIIAKFFHKFYSLVFLRNLCGISKAGISIPLSLVGTTKKMAQWLGGKHTLILI